MARFAPKYIKSSNSLLPTVQLLKCSKNNSFQYNIPPIVYSLIFFKLKMLPHPIKPATQSSLASYHFSPAGKKSSRPSGKRLLSTRNKIANIPSKLSKVLPEPPLAFAAPRKEALNFPQRRIKRKSKYTKEQDQQIINLKRQGNSWEDIAEIIKVGSALAVRNRYQVLIGQQGGAITTWHQNEVVALQRLLDDGENEKWRFIAKEMRRNTGKEFTDLQCQTMIKSLFWSNPSTFGITDEAFEKYTNGDSSKAEARSSTPKGNSRESISTTPIATSPYPATSASQISSPSDFNNNTALTGMGMYTSNPITSSAFGSANFLGYTSEFTTSRPLMSSNDPLSIIGGSTSSSSANDTSYFMNTNPLVSNHGFGNASQNNYFPPIVSTNYFPNF